ncbi:MAG: TIGR03620 family F420-dependent LLM class oxidoreductase [Ilumatobacter sp.]|nr:TIGR03620 family F420-dependent LLM class oxidoreductase [Ilumatobacter sp.]
MTGVIVAADTMSLTDLVEYVQRLEALGYDSVWIPDMFGREIYVTAGLLLSNTTTLNVATGIAHVYGRDATASAQAARTLSELSGGRFIHGLGVSHPPAAELRGHDWEPPIEKMRAYLTELRTAMSGGLLHTPADPPPTPIYVAAHGPKMTQVAAELADGVNTYMQPPEHTATSRATLGPDKELSVVLPCVLTTDVDAARAAGRRALHIYLSLPAYHRQWAAFGFDESDWDGRASDRLVDAYVAWGDVDAIRRRAEEHVAAGATQVQLSVNHAERGATGPPWELLEAMVKR